MSTCLNGDSVIQESANRMALLHITDFNAHYHTYEVSYLTTDSVSIEQKAMKCRLTANVINSRYCGILYACQVIV